MDKLVLTLSAILGLVLIFIYFFRCWRSGVEFSHSVMINTVFQSSGMVCGFLLVTSIFFPDVKKIIADIDIYILVSGLAVFMVSIQGYHRDAIKNTQGNRSKNSGVIVTPD